MTQKAALRMELVLFGENVPELALTKEYDATPLLDHGPTAL